LIARKDVGSRKDRESQYKGSGGTRKHVEFAQFFDGLWIDELRIVRLRFSLSFIAF